MATRKVTRPRAAGNKTKVLRTKPTKAASRRKPAKRVSYAGVPKAHRVRVKRLRESLAAVAGGSTSLAPAAIYRELRRNWKLAAEERAQRVAQDAKQQRVKKFRESLQVTSNSDRAEARHWLMGTTAGDTLRNVRSIISYMREEDLSASGKLDLSEEGRERLLETVQDALKVQTEELERNQQRLFKALAQEDGARKEGGAA